MLSSSTLECIESFFFFLNIKILGKIFTRILPHFESQNCNKFSSYFDLLFLFLLCYRIKMSLNAIKNGKSVDDVSFCKCARLKNFLKLLEYFFEKFFSSPRKKKNLERRFGEYCGMPRFDSEQFGRKKIIKT